MAIIYNMGGVLKIKKLIGDGAFIPISNPAFRSCYNLDLEQLIALSPSYENLWNKFIVLI